MGNPCSKVRHIVDDKADWNTAGDPGKRYGPEPPEHYEQLNTERDQKGQTVVNHLIKATRLVFGQPATDMMLNPVNWAEYGVEFRARASPYDFPAFQHEKPKEDNKKYTSVERTKSQQTGSTDLRKTKSNDGGSKNAKVKSKDGSSDTKKIKSKSGKSGKSKTGAGDKPGKRVSHNAEMDHCSLEEDPA
uniref:PCNA-clamp-associated factor n=1 Tax=Panagrellus redivivus TaxID=6233 RepID=A0A7E4ZZD1_PANRE